MTGTDRLCYNAFRSMRRGAMAVKYFTKEWYMAMQKSSLELLFRADERAAELNEALYEEIFESEVQKKRKDIENFYLFIKDDEDEEMSEDQIIPDLFDYLYRITGNEAHKLRKPAYEYVLCQHPEALLEVVRLQIDDKILYNRTFYPPEILAIVADEQVFACRVASDEVISRMKEISQRNQRFVDETFKKARLRRKTLEGKVSGEILKYFDFHDVEVTGLRWEGSDLIIELDEGCNFDEILSIRLHDCEIKQMDEGIEGAYWLYQELDMESDGRIRAGVLLTDTEAQGGTEERLRQLELTARDITFIRAEGAEEREIRNQKIHEELIRMGVDMTKPSIIQH